MAELKYETSIRKIVLKGLNRRLPITQWLPNYRISTGLHDLLAGFTVCLVEVPQAVAFSAIAGLTLEYGLYSIFMPLFVYTIFGTCKDINIGPTVIVCLIL